MFGRWLIVALIGVSLLGGYPYAALLLNRVLGTNTATLTEHDGRTSTLVFGPSAPRPDWVPVPASAWVVTATQWVSGKPNLPAGSVDLLSHQGTDALKSFFVDALAERDCVVADNGTGNLAPQVAQYLAIDKFLSADCPKAASALSITIRTSAGWVLPSRMVEVRWQRAPNIEAASPLTPRASPSGS